MKGWRPPPVVERSGGLKTPQSERRNKPRCRRRIARPKQTSVLMMDDNDDDHVVDDDDHDDGIGGNTSI